VFALLVVAVLAGCGLVGAHDRKDVSELMSMIDQVGYCRLDEVGVKEIEATQIAKFNLRSGTETLAAVGLVGRQLGPAIGGPSKPELVLALDGPKGRDVAITRTIMVGIDDLKGTLNDITFWRKADTLYAAIDEVRQGIQRWGYFHKDVDGWAEGVTEDRTKDDKAVVSYGVSPAGLMTSVEVNYEPSRPVVLQYVVYIAKWVYDPRNLESVRTTGQPDSKVIDEATKGR
jgi:hypothetical protein